MQPGEQHETDSSSEPSGRTTTNILILNSEITFYFLNYPALLYFATAALVNEFMLNVGLRIAWPSFCRQKESTKMPREETSSDQLIWLLNVNFVLPRWHSGEESACRCRRSRFNPWVGDPLEQGKATNSIILAWRIPWIEEPGGLQSIGSQRVRHN